MCADVVDIEVVESQLARRLLTGRPGPLVVAAHAISIQQRTLRRNLRLSGGRRLRLNGLGRRGLAGGRQCDRYSKRRDCHARDSQSSLRHRCVLPLG